MYVFCLLRGHCLQQLHHILSTLLSEETAPSWQASTPILLSLHIIITSPVQMLQPGIRKFGKKMIKFTVLSFPTQAWPLIYIPLPYASFYKSLRHMLNKVDQSGLVAVVALPLILISLRCQFLLRVLMTRKCFKMYRAVVFALWVVILVVTLPSDSHCLCLDLQNLLTLRWIFILYSACRCDAIFNPSGSWVCWS